MRIFTNDEATVNCLRRADGRVRAIAWHGALSFGKLPVGEDLDAFAADRARTFAEAGWDEDGVVEADGVLLGAELREAVVSEQGLTLLFGGSLGDQLQLAHIVYWLSSAGADAVSRVKLMVVDGPLSVFDDGALHAESLAASSLGEDNLRSYREAWLGFTAADPRGAEMVFRRLVEGHARPSLASAMERWLQELPSVENGLSITEAQILEAAKLGIAAPLELFRAVQETELVAFRTNWEFWQILDRLCSGEEPLLELSDGSRFLCPPRVLAWTAFQSQALVPTERGLAVLAGERNYAQGEYPERWLGGSLISGASGCFWDYGKRAVVGGSMASS